MKRSLNILFGLVLLSVFSMKAQFSGGTGSETDPFIIKTRTDLETTLNEYNNKTGFYFKLASGSDGFLNLKGFVPNEQIDIYNSSGMKVYSVKAKGSELNVKLPVHEVYIISAGAQQIKVLH
jgi:hypothetical protein